MCVCKGGGGGKERGPDRISRNNFLKIHGHMYFHASRI